jgi:hypothetical protein
MSPKGMIWILWVIFVIGAGIFLIIENYHLDRDIDSLIDRAQVSADRDDMLDYIKQLKVNMEKYGMTSGYNAVIFKKPINDLAQHYKTVGRYIERLESLKDLPKNETTYQVALEDLRGAIRELPNPASGFLWVKYGCLLFWICMGWLVFNSLVCKDDILEILAT